MGKRPANPAYPTSLNTLGDHLRKVRLDRGLYQSDVARIIGVTTEAVTGWELNRHSPSAKFAKAIIAFLGYFPFSFDGQSLGKQLHYARLITGKTQEEAADLIGCDESTLRCIELDEQKPIARIREKIEGFIHAAFESLAGSAVSL